MSAPRRFEHARLRVNDLGDARAFYTGVMGLVELGEEDGTVYLGAGLDENFDLAIVEGGTGVEHFALRVDSDDELDRAEQLVRAAGLAAERRSGTGPGEVEAVACVLPSGHAMEFVTVADHRYLEPYRPALDGRGPMGLIDADHINLSAADVRGLAEFVRDAFGWRHSDLIDLGDMWLAAWTRMGEFHHDVAVLHTDDPAETLHHFAWNCASIDHLKVCCDRLADAGIRLEIGVGRHPAGANVFAYFWDPGGNRMELSTEMALLDAATEPRVWTSTKETFDVWGDPIVPDSFRRGS